MVERIANFFTSLKLTVVLLSLGLLLVFVGTLAQVNEGLYQAQARYFRSWFIWGPILFGKKLPILLPGGYLLGSMLLVNLVAAHLKRFQLTWKKLGIHLTHGGLILLLLGQLLTDALSTESAMRLAEGESKNYSEDFRENELVVIDKANPEHDEVVAIPESVLSRQREIKHEKLPFTVRVQNYWANSSVSDQPMNNSLPVKVSQGMGNGLHLLPLNITTAMDERNIPSAIIELFGPQGSLGTWLVHSLASAKQAFQVGARLTRSPCDSRVLQAVFLKLLEFKHEKYAGTETPRNFESRVRINNPKTNERREVEIYMNNPLRYNGETYYQASFDPNNDKLVNKVTILQVVRNPSWLTPYFACGLMTLGLTVQFMMHLIGFARKRRAG
jgi:hypothetical protein